MLKATEAYSIAKEVNNVHDILCKVEDAISKAAEQGKFRCSIELDVSYRKHIAPAVKIVVDAGYVVHSNLFNKSEDKDKTDDVYVIDISWEGADL